MAFDAQAAKAAGYSDTEIADYLGQQAKFDTGAARQAGYSDQEIIGHLTGSGPLMAKSSATPAQPSVSPAQAKANADAQASLKGDIGAVRATDNGFAFNALPNIDAAINAGVTGARNAFAHATGRPDAGYGMKEAFSAMRGAESGQMNAFAQAHPVQNIAANVAGAVANPVNALAGRYVAGAASLPSAIARGVGSGAALGAAYGAGGAQPGQDVAQQAQQGAEAGAISGAAAPVVGSLAGAAGRALGLGGRNSQPVVDALQSAKTAAYQSVDNMGAAYTPDAAKSLAQGIQDELKAGNISETRHPKAFSMMQDIQDRLATDKPVSLADLDQLRQEVYRDVANPRNDPAEQHFGHAIINNIDEFLSAAGPDQMANGSGPGAAQAIQDARSANARYRKVQTVTNALDSGEMRANASGVGGNTNNAIRQRLRPFIDPTSNRRIPGLTSDERNQMSQIVNGTPLNNALRLAGSLSPDRGGLPLMAQAGLGVATVGHSWPVAMAALVARHVADRQTQQVVESLISQMAQGSPGETTNAERQLAFMASKDAGVAAVYREIRARLTGAAPALASSAVNQMNQPAGAPAN